MKAPLRTLTLIAGLAFGLASAVVAFHQPPAPAQGAQAKPGDSPPTKEVFQRVCSKCHELEQVTASRRSRAQWEDVIDKMITLGAKATDAEFNTILGYLIRQYGRVNVNTATIHPSIVLFDISSSFLCQYPQFLVTADRVGCARHSDRPTDTITAVSVG